MAEEQDDKQQQKNGKPIHGLGLRYNSKNVNFDMVIPDGLLHRMRLYLADHWKTVAWRSFITLLAAFPTIYGVSLGNMTIADKTRLSALETKAAKTEKLEVEVKGIAETLRLKSVDYDALFLDVQTLKMNVSIYKEITEEDGKVLQQQQQQERDQKSKKELEEHNRQRAEKLKRIGENLQLSGGEGLFPVKEQIK